MRQARKGEPVSCAHENFDAWVDVGRITDGDDGPVIGFAADVRIECTGCGHRFGFRGLTPGMPPNEPGVTPDALEAHLPLISPEELETIGPLAALKMPSGLTGYKINVRGGGMGEP
jgi:hypothetical protein